MKKDDIKLPPLPEGSMMDDLCGLMPSEIRQALTIYAREAIEFDRQQRGEPVAMTLGQKAVAAELLACFTAWDPMVYVLGNVRASDGADLMQAILNLERKND